jgi:hypothetical protein
MSNGLEDVPVRVLFLDHSSRLSLAIHVHHDTRCRQTTRNEDEDERAKCPSPVVFFYENLANRGTGKGGGNSGSTIKGENDHAVLEGRDIGSHNIGNVENTDVPGPVP